MNNAIELIRHLPGRQQIRSMPGSVRCFAPAGPLVQRGTDDSHPPGIPRGEGARRSSAASGACTRSSAGGGNWLDADHPSYTRVPSLVFRGATAIMMPVANAPNILISAYSMVLQFCGVTSIASTRPSVNFEISVGGLGVTTVKITQKDSGNSTKCRETTRRWPRSPHKEAIPVRNSNCHGIGSFRRF